MDGTKEAWAAIMAQLESTKTSIDPDSFLLHFWLSRRGSVSKANLFKEYKTAITKSSARKALADLRSSSVIYVRAMAPMEREWAKEQASLRDSLAAIRVFGVSQVAPLMLSLLELFERKVISLKSAAKAFELIEKFTFQFNALTQSRGGGGVSNMYAKLAQNVSRCGTPQEFVGVLGEIRSKFDERIPTLDEFSAPFRLLNYKTTYTRERDIVRYALAKIARQLGQSKEIDLNLMTVEHIRPQSKGPNTFGYDDVGAIGNLILIPEDLNGKIDDKEFSPKIKALEKSPMVFMDDYLKAADAWTQKDITERGKALAVLGYEKIWKI